MTVRADKIKLALFLGTTAVVLGGLLYVITGRALWEETHTYYVRSPQTIYGLERGADVQIRGVPAGSVERFRLFPGGYEGVVVEIRVSAGMRIPRGAIAELRYRGLTGLKAIDIIGGSLAAGTLEPGATLEAQQDALDLAAEQATALLAQTELLLANLTALTGPEVERGVERLITRADAMLLAGEDAARAVSGAARGTGRAIAELETSAGEARRAIDEGRETLAAAATTLDQIRSMVTASRGPIGATLSNLRRASESLVELGRELRLQPSRLFFSRPPEERDLP